MFLLLCLPSGCGHPFGSLVSFVTFDRNRRWPLEWGFSFVWTTPVYVWGRSFPTSSVTLSWLLLAGVSAFLWLVPVLPSPHLFLASSAASPGALGVLGGFVCGCAPSCCRDWGFPMLPDCSSPSIRLWVYWFQWLLFSTGVPYLRDGVTPAGSRFVCPRS